MFFLDIYMELRLYSIDCVNEPYIVPSNVSTLFPYVGKPVEGFTYFTSSTEQKFQAYRHVLTNCTIVDPFRE